MATIAFPKETQAGEKRCSLLPINIKGYTRMGATVLIESGLGASVHIADGEYEEAGAKVISSREELFAQADIIASLHKLDIEQLPLVKPNALMVSFLDPFNEGAYIEELSRLNLSSISVEMLPRISRCQKMDALSSQASLAGYVMVAKGMNQLQSILPMMMTPSGTIKPTKVFVIGAGVAGLQAIATARRMGAQVTAFDTRPVVAEQVQSLGAKFLEIDLGQTSETGQGYATALTPEQMAIQQREQAKCIIDSDLVITTAQLFGRRPPVLIKKDVIEQMKPGSVIVDMAAENGGNVEGSVSGETVDINGISIVGKGRWANEVAKDASQMYANNLFSLFAEFWDEESGEMPIDLGDEVMSSCVITHQGDIVNSVIREHLTKEVA